jgi:hypothetical protein
LLPWFAMMPTQLSSRRVVRRASWSRSVDK